MIRRFFAILLCLVASFAVGALDAAPHSSAFTYQGRLSELGLPAAGAHDFQFSLHHQPSGGAPVAASLTVTNVPVSNGLFTVILDFGLDAFSGSESWLEVAVRRTGVAGEFFTLTPRQPLTPAPYSLFTLKAASLAGSLPDTQLSTNIARLDSSQIFRGEVSFERSLTVGSGNQPASLEVNGSVRAGSFAGDGGALSNVVAAGLSVRQMQRLWRIPIPFVAITNAGNLPDLNGKGAVPDDFRIGKYEINNHQYVAFLNAVATDDPRSLYNTNSAAESHAGIVRTGAPGEFFYEVKPGMGHQPVVMVDFYDVLRFCNWLHNGQPSGAQDATTTEDGAYTLTPATLAAENVLRNLGARFWLPSDDEWYKAAYHQPLDTGGEFGDYWTYPTRSLDVPISEPPPGGPNSVNACCDTGRMATDVGAYSLAHSYYGTYDQGGNVQEWTEWTDEFSPLRNRRIRGGSWDYNEYYSGKDDYEFDTTDYDSNSIGFRVAGRPDLF